MQNKKKNVRYVTEKGTAIFPYLIEPDTKFNSDGEFKVKLKLAPDANLATAKGDNVGNFQYFLDELMEKSLAKAQKDNPDKKRIKTADDPYTFDDDGALLVNFKLKANVSTREGKTFQQRPALFDSKGKPFDGDELWGGSLVKVAFEAVPFYTAMIGAGITLRLKAVQVIELRQGGEASADSYGFGEEEGYESAEASKQDSDDYGFSDDDDIPFDTAEDSNGDF